MLKKETTGDGDTVGNSTNSWARACDTCHETACTVYCKADSVYLCSTCDSRIHAANGVASRHVRLWVCEACENAPAAFLCKADAASLCSGCDATIHSANPLARRHQRVPILPISGDIIDSGRMNEELFGITEDGEEENEDETDSWLLISNPGNSNKKESYGNGLVFGGEVDEYFDLDSCTGDSNRNRDYGDESVVPVDCEEGGKDEMHEFQIGFEFECLKSGYDFHGSINHVVPAVSSMEQEVSNTYMSHYNSIRAPKGTIDLFTNNSTSDEMSIMRDREARVLRYREKKKNRKFEKTIRYASRKAYAETRPRIKGRFAKRSSSPLVDHLFPIVPAGF